MPPSRSPKSTLAARNEANEVIPTAKRYSFVATGWVGRVYRAAYDEEAKQSERPLPPPELLQPVEKRPPPLKLADLEIIRTLGEGAEGRVFLVRTTRRTHEFDKPGTLFAMKALRKKFERQLKPVDAHMSGKDAERRALVTLPWNPFITGIVDAFDDPRNLYLMLEFIPCGTLHSLIRQHSPMPLASAAFYFANIVLALEFIHTAGIAHRDIKPQNFLLGADGYLCLSDFGCAFQNYDETWADIGTPLYRAPEMDPGPKNEVVAEKLEREAAVDGGPVKGGDSQPAVDGDSIVTDPPATQEIDSQDLLQRNLSVDWYSAGIVLYEMATKKVPFYGRDTFSTTEKKRSGVIPWPETLRLGRNFKALVGSLLDVDPDQRPGPEEVQESAWLGSMDWERMDARQYLPPNIPRKVSPSNMGLWHTHPLPNQRQVPGLKVVDPPSHLVHDNRFPEGRFL